MAPQRIEQRCAGVARRNCAGVRELRRRCAGIAQNCARDVLLDGRVDFGHQVVQCGALEQSVHLRELLLALLLGGGRADETGGGRRGRRALHLAQPRHLGLQLGDLLLEAADVLLLAQPRDARRLGLPLHPLRQLLLLGHRPRVELRDVGDVVVAQVLDRVERRLLLELHLRRRRRRPPRRLGEPLAGAPARLGQRRHRGRQRDALQRLLARALPARLRHRVLARRPHEAREEVVIDEVVDAREGARVHRLDLGRQLLVRHAPTRTPESRRESFCAGAAFCDL